MHAADTSLLCWERHSMCENKSLFRGLDGLSKLDLASSHGLNTGRQLGADAHWAGRWDGCGQPHAVLLACEELSQLLCPCLPSRGCSECRLLPPHCVLAQRSCTCALFLSSCLMLVGPIARDRRAQSCMNRMFEKWLGGKLAPPYSYDDGDTPKTGLARVGSRSD